MFEDGILVCGIRVGFFEKVICKIEFERWGGVGEKNRSFIRGFAGIDLACSRSSEVICVIGV